MPLSAAFCFFSPFFSEKKLLHQSFSLQFSFLSFISFFSLFISLSCQFPFNAYIRNLALVIKYNKRLEDFRDVQNSLKIRDIA